MTTNADPRIDRLEGPVQEMSNHLHSLEQNTNARFNSLEQNTNARFSSLESRITIMWVTTLATIITGVITILVAVLLQ